MKEEIRKKLLERRNSLSTYEILKKSNEIIKKLESLKEFEKNKIECYISFGSEVYTHGLIRKYVNEKAIFVPVIDKKNGILYLSHLKDWKELETGVYGILQPRKECLRMVDFKEVELAIVPGIAFDEEGNRIGYGKGYYDRLLSKLDAVKVALAYDFQIMSRIPNEKHDVKMDVIVTDKRIIRC